MKIQFLIVIIALCGLTYSCQKCELIDQIVTPPPVQCHGTFYIIKASPELDTTFYLYQFSKPIPEPFSAINIAGPFNIPVTFGNYRSNFSAYDSVNRLYVFQHFYPAGSQFFSYQLGTDQPALTPGPRIDVCPVFHKPSNKLHSMFTEYLGGSDWLYNIAQINALTGQDGAGITGNSITTNSPLAADYMSSVSNGGDLLFFLSQTNLIVVDLSNSSTWHYDIDLSYHALDNPIQYFGLEFKRDEGLLIAMKQAYDGMGISRTSLVSIDISGSNPVVSQLYDISASMPKGIERSINPEFYSTTFDPCDNTYYITSIQPGSITNTGFIELSLDNNTFKHSTLDGYWYGSEYVNE